MADDKNPSLSWDIRWRNDLALVLKEGRAESHNPEAKVGIEGHENFAQELQLRPIRGGPLHLDKKWLSRDRPFREIRSGAVFVDDDGTGFGVLDHSEDD